MLYLTGIIITFFLVFILLSKRNKTIADIILLCWLSFIGAHLFLYYFSISGKDIQHPYLLGVGIPLPLIHGPFLFLYTSAVTNQLKNWKRNILHFFPILISYISILDFFLLTNEEKKLVFEKHGQGYETITFIIYKAVLFSGIFYVIWSLLLLGKHKKNILNQFSYSEKINLYWLRYLIYGIGLIWIFVILGNDNLLFSTAVFFVIFIGYFGINQVGVFTNETPPIRNKIQERIPLEIISILNNTSHKKQEIKNPLEKVKYEKSKISTSDVNTIHKKLSEIMQTEKVYLNSELTLSDLAQKMKVHPNILSQVINSVERKNFYDYINFQRVEELKRIILLPENQKFTLLSLAFECGFNSKTSFNRNFKKVTTLSPTEYLKQGNAKIL